MALYDKYQNLYKKYSDIYGDQLILFHKIGAFYEMYAYYKNQEIITLVSIMSNLNIIKKHQKLPPSKTNYLIIGFPTVAFDKYIEKCQSKLNDLGYTLIFYNNAYEQLIFTPKIQLKDEHYDYDNWENLEEYVLEI